jgi:hypothetical protein
MYRAIMATTRSKAVFQIDALDDLADLTKQIFAGVLDPMKVKHWTTTVVGYERQPTASRTKGFSRQEGGSDGTNANDGSVTSRRVSPSGNDEEGITVESENEGSGRNSARNWSETEIDSVTTGEMLVPILGKEVGQYASLDEQLATFQQIVNGQDKRRCMVRLVSMKTPVPIQTLDVPPAWVDAVDVDAYLAARFRSLRYALPLAQAIESAVKREADFMQSIMATVGEIEPAKAGRKIKAVPSVTVKTKPK